MKEKDEKGSWKGLTSLISSIGGAGIGYIAAQCGSIAYIAAREITNFATGSSLAPIPELLADYAIYTSAAAFVGEIGGYILHKKIWKTLRGD
ncbi:MAG: hypothetical protein QW423_02240 [Candidatus Aenigmatarchaeota archaeon]